MSEGPIKQWRDGFGVRPQRASERVCMKRKDRGYCGRKSSTRFAESWRQVTCVECLAGARADGVIR